MRQLRKALQAHVSGNLLKLYIQQERYSAGLDWQSCGASEYIPLKSVDCPAEPYWVSSTIPWLFTVNIWNFAKYFSAKNRKYFFGTCWTETTFWTLYWFLYRRKFYPHNGCTQDDTRLLFQWRKSLFSSDREKLGTASSVVELGVKYQLVSSQTSFVVIEERKIPTSKTWFNIAWKYFRWEYEKSWCGANMAFRIKKPWRWYQRIERNVSWAKLYGQWASFTLRYLISESQHWMYI